MAGIVEYLPGSRAVLVHCDEYGDEHLCLVEVVNRRVDQGVTTYVVKVRTSAKDYVIRMIPNPYKEALIGEGWTIGIVRADSLRPFTKTHSNL